MRLGESLFFSPRYLFSDIDWNEKETVLSAFEDRLFGYFLVPGKTLEDSGHGFGQCVLLLAAIHFLANFVGTPGDSNQTDFRRILLERTMLLAPRTLL